MRYMAILFLPLMLIGCATIFESSTQELSIRTSPTGATVFIDGEKQDGVTPMEVIVRKKGGGLELRFEREGYVTDYYFVRSGDSAWTIPDWIP